MKDSPAALPNVGLALWDFVAVGAYLLVTFGVSAWAARRHTSTEDFFVGGRRMPWMAVGLSILATLFSTISYLGVPGEAVKNGIGLSLGYLALPFSFADRATLRTLLLHHGFTEPALDTVAALMRRPRRMLAWVLAIPSWSSLL